MLVNLEEDILYHLDQKLPLPIQMVYNLAAGCSPHQEFKLLLYEYVKPKIALNSKQVWKVVTWYFEDHFIYCEVFYGFIFVEYMYKKNYSLTSDASQDKKEPRV